MSMTSEGAGLKKRRAVFFAAPMERIRRERRQRMLALAVSVAVGALLLALCAWLLWVIVAAAGVTGLTGMTGVTGLAMVPVTQAAVMVALLFFSALAVFLAVRKVRRDEVFFASLRERQGDDVFEPLREKTPGSGEPGYALPPEDAHRILVACAAEARCVAKHVRRAQVTMSVEDYGDELELASRKLDAVIRCVEALAARCAGMTKPETRNQKDAEVLGDIECCEIEGRDAV